MDCCEVCLVYADDILVTGKTEQEHLQTLDAVLTRLEAAGLRLKQTKCTFMKPSVEYLGYNVICRRTATDTGEGACSY